MNTSTFDTTDLNAAQVAGEVIRIRQLGDYVIVNLRTKVTGDIKPSVISLALPGGQVSGHDTSILLNDQVKIAGWVRDLPYEETLEEFLKRAKEEKTLVDYPELKVHTQLKITRAITCVVPTEQALFAEASEVAKITTTLSEANLVRVDGIVVRTWKYGNHDFARIKIRDQHCDVKDDQRVPHYLTIQFTRRSVGGRPITVSTYPSMPGLKQGDRIRVVGKFIQRVYFENLRDWLHDAKQIAIMATLPNPDRLSTVRAKYIQTTVEAVSVIQFG